MTSKAFSLISTCAALGDWAMRHAFPCAAHLKK
jgi:hypothetical protein